MEKYIFIYEIEYILTDLNWIFTMKPTKFKISISVESYDEKTTDNYRNCYIDEKHIVSKLSKISILVVQIEDLNEDGVKSSRLYILYFLRYKPSKGVTVGPVRSVRVGPGRFIVLND